jgi:hypothetical protein
VGGRILLQSGEPIGGPQAELLDQVASREGTGDRILCAYQTDGEFGAGFGKAQDVLWTVVKIEDHLRRSAHRGDHVRGAPQDGLTHGDPIADMLLEQPDEVQVLAAPGIPVGKIDPGKIGVLEPAFSAQTDSSPIWTRQPSIASSHGNGGMGLTPRIMSSSTPSHKATTPS